MINIGQVAPEFCVPDQHGTPTTLTGLLSNGELLLYFYPADFTPVCTTQACMFRDNAAELRDVNVQVAGVSPQGSDSHTRFADRHGLPFTLLCDKNKLVIRAYGVDGPFGLGVRRATFLIDRQGVVRSRVLSDFFVASHATLIKKTLQERT